LVKAKLCWLDEVEIGYSGTRFGTRFWCVFATTLARPSGDRTLAQATMILPASLLAHRGAA
jgi:hypothetical protein